MYNNILTYLCFITICGLVVLDMWLSTNILLQIVCILLVCVVVCLTAYIAHKWHKGTYLSNEQQNNLQSYLSDNIALQKELNNLQTKQATNKINSNEVQQTILTNSRLTAQNSNLKAHIQTLTELLQNLKNQGTTVVLPIAPNEQQTNNLTHIKKQKSA